MADNYENELCRLVDVHMDYGREEVLKGVDLSVERATITGLVGSNGSGKSTLLKILTGILKPKRGHLLFFDDNKTIGYMPENCGWYPYLTGEQVLRYFARFKRVTRPDRDEILERVGLWPARNKKVGAYSKGMKQKLGLAIALVGSPPLIVLDEPTNGLDPQGIFDFYRIMQSMVSQGSTVILSSHLLVEIEDHVSHVAFIGNGAITASGPRATLIRDSGLLCRVSIQFDPGQVDHAAVPACRQTFAERGWSVTGSETALEVSLPESELQSLFMLVGESAARVIDINVQRPGLDELYRLTSTEAVSAAERTIR